MYHNTSSRQGPPGPLRELVLFGLMLRRGALAALTFVVCMVFGAGAALAYWPASGTGSTTAAVGTLAPPTNVSAPAMNVATVPLTWTASAGAVAPAGYYVTRITDGTPLPACDSSPSALLTATSCMDTSAPVGTYTYQVTAVFRSWTAISAASPEVSVVLGVTKTLTFTSQPAGVITAGSTIGPLKVEARNQFGLMAPNVRVTLGMGTNPSGASLQGTLNVNTDQFGIATFNDLSIVKAGADYSLVASSGGYSSAASSSFTVTGAAATELVVMTATPLAGVASATASLGPITVERRDVYGNPATAGSTTITLTAASGGAGVFATTVGGASVPSVNIPAGLASTEFFYRDTKSGPRPFTMTGLGTPVTVPVEISAAAPKKLVFDAFAAKVYKDTPFAATVRIQDEFNNQTQSTATVTLKSTAACTVTIPSSNLAAIAGTATFSQLTVSSKKNNCQLTATSPGLFDGIVTFNVL